MRRLPWLLIVLACISLPRLALAALTGVNAAYVGTDIVGAPVSLGGDLVLEIDGVRGLVRDYADPASPRWVGSVHLGGGIVERGVHQDGLVIGLHRPEFRGATLVDVHDPAAPVVLSDTFAPYHYSSAVVVGTTLYLLAADWLLGYDIADPGAPEFVAVVPLQVFAEDRQPSRVGDLLYLRDGASALRVLDVREPSAPADLGQISLAHARIDAITIGHGHLYALAAGSGGLVLATWDLADPLAPLQVDEALLAPAGVDGVTLATAGEVLYAATDDGLLRAFSLADPAHPVPGFKVPGEVRSMIVTENSLLLEEADDRLSVLARTEFDDAPAVLAVRRELPDLAEVETNGRVSVASEYPTGDLLFIDLADPTSPVLASSRTGLDVREVAVCGDRAVVCNSVEYLIFDISEPWQPRELVRERFPAADLDVIDCALTDRLLAISLPTHGTLLYDQVDQAPPRLVFTLRQARSRVELEGDRLATVTAQGRAAIYDVSDPGSPQRLPLLPPSGVRAVDVNHGDVLVQIFGRLLVYRLDGTGAWQQLAQVPVPDAGRLTVAGGRAYAYTNTSVTIVDVADPAAPAIAGSLDGDGVMLGFATESGLIHLFMGLASFQVRDETWAPAAVAAAAPPPAARLLAPRPNPFNPATTIAFAADAAQPVRLAVHDARGRLVAVLADGVVAAGRHEATWRGVDAAGRPVASGVYLVRLTDAAGAAQCRRVTLVR